jgi:hypothetical protein
MWAQEVSYKFRNRCSSQANVNYEVYSVTDLSQKRNNGVETKNLSLTQKKYQSWIDRRTKVPIRRLSKGTIDRDRLRSLGVPGDKETYQGMKWVGPSNRRRKKKRARRPREFIELESEGKRVK